MKGGRLKCNKERIRTTRQTMQLKREIKQGKLNIKKGNKRNTNKIKVVNIIKKIIIIYINNKMPAVWDSRVTLICFLVFRVRLVLPLSIHFGPILTPCLIFSLVEKKGKIKKREDPKR